MSWTIQVYDDIDAARQQWESFFAATPTSSLMMTWQYASLWWKYFGSNATPYIISVTDEHRQGLIAPLMKQGKNLAWIGTPEADSISFLYNAPEKLPAAIHALADHLKQISWAELHVRYLHKAQLDLLMAALDLPFHMRDETASPTVFHQGRTWEQYWESLSSKFRSDVRRKHRKLENDGLTMRFETVHDPDSVTKYFPTIKAIVGMGHIPEKIAGMEGKRGEFLLNMWRQYAECGWLELNLCYLNDTIRAYSLNYVINGAGSGVSVGYDPEFRDYAPGKLLVEYVFQNSFNRGDSMFDMQHGPDEYKLPWTPDVQPLGWVTIYHNPMQKRLVELKRELKQTIKQKILKKA